MKGLLRRRRGTSRWHRGKMEIVRCSRRVDSLLFAIGSIVLFGLLPIFDIEGYKWFLVPAQFSIVFYFFRGKSPLFGPSLFILLLSLTYLLPLIPSIWLLNLIIAIAAYLIIAFSFDSMRKDIDWLKSGHIGKSTALEILLIVIISSAALIAWDKIFEPDIGSYAKAIPEAHVSIILAGIIGFAVLNGTAEEIMFRGIFQSGLEKAFHNIAAVIILQALFFGLCHYNGFPSGTAGAALSFVYGLLLGILKHRSKGLLAPAAAHIFADITIAVTVLKNIGRI